MLRNNKKIILNDRRGFALLFAVLTASLLLTIGIAIFSISFKELSISTSARESQVAFYAADSARECALYWDVKKGAFPACLDTKTPCTMTTGPSTIVCNGSNSSDILSNHFSTGAGNITYNSSTTNPFMQFSFTTQTGPDPLSPQADVTVSKTFNALNSNIVTTISAEGHNVSQSGRRLERGITQTY